MKKDELIDMLFPFEYVQKDSRVIIYGYGIYGRSYIEQINETKWCKVVGIIDRKYKSGEVDKLIDISICGKKDFYDYIVVAVKQCAVGKYIIEELEKNGAKKEQIIFHQDRHIKAEDGRGDNDLKAILQSNELDVLLLGSGGMGDGIMDTAFINRIVEIVPDVVIDVCGQPFLKYVYYGIKNIRNIYDENATDDMDYYGYDLVVMGGWHVDVKFCKYEKLKEKSEILYNLVIESENRLKEYEKTSKVGMIYYRVKEAQINNKDRFWLMGYGDLWNLSSEIMELKLNPDFMEEYKNLGLGKYITINSGVDKRFVKDMESVKTWSLEYFTKFILKFKKAYPQIQVVQISGKDAPIIKGADRYIMGSHLEVAKYVLKSSLLHIDSEGGLVHMATALRTKCVVLFGATPMVLSYRNNINICADTCLGCFDLRHDWNTHCINNTKFKKCMFDITPDMVMDKVKEYMVTIGEYKQEMGVSV
jgi:ADP-heptose:LPS heptosyltransferase